MTSLNFLNNNLFADGGKALADALKGNNVMQELNISSNDLNYNSNYNLDMSGIIAISDAIPTMGALVKLLMAKNKIATKEAGEALGQALAKNSVLKELRLIYERSLTYLISSILCEWV